MTSEAENMPEPLGWLYEDPDGERRFFHTEDEWKEWLLAKSSAERPVVGFLIPLVSRVDYWKLAERYDEATKPWVSSFGEPETFTR